jgi:cytoskeletal protein RodZ
MTNKGKHASQTPGTFYRDLGVMILGIIVVGAAVFFLLYLFADQPVTGPTTSTTALAETSSTGEGVTSTSGDNVTTSTTLNTTSTSVVAVRPPGEVTVVVLNSMGLDGAAGRITQRLADAGYQTLTPDNFTPEQDPSRIWYREGFAPEAAELADLLPGADVEPLPDDSLQEGADVVLVLGTGFTE